MANPVTSTTAGGLKVQGLRFRKRQGESFCVRKRETAVFVCVRERARERARERKRENERVSEGCRVDGSLDRV